MKTTNISTDERNGPSWRLIKISRCLKMCIQHANQSYTDLYGEITPFHSLTTRCNIKKEKELIEPVLVFH